MNKTKRNHIVLAFSLLVVFTVFFSKPINVSASNISKGWVYEIW
jgi:hypothetical protein